jgi:hypothetical protein
VALQGATAADFDAVDADGRGAGVLSEFCAWVVSAEDAAGTAWGEELSVGDEGKAAVAAAVDAAGVARQSNAEAGGVSADGSVMPSELVSFLGSMTGHSHDEAGKVARQTMWRAWDGNGNGMLSLAEVDLCVKRQVGEDLWRRYRPSYIRAFTDAADAVPDGKRVASKLTKDDVVTRAEFRLLLSYLRLYATMYEVFAMVDGMGAGVDAMDDRKISREEWEAMLGALAAAGKSWAPFVALQGATAADFDAVDADGRGAVVLSEFCAWVVSAEKAAGTAWGEELSVGDREAGLPGLVVVEAVEVEGWLRRIGRGGDEDCVAGLRHHMVETVAALLVLAGGSPAGLAGLGRQGGVWWGGGAAAAMWAALRPL